MSMIIKPVEKIFPTSNNHQSGGSNQSFNQNFQNSQKDRQSSSFEEELAKQLGIKLEQEETIDQELTQSEEPIRRLVLSKKPQNIKKLYDEK